VIVLQPFPEFGRRVEDLYLHGRSQQQANRILDFLAEPSQVIRP
jgi:hypothetical protein